MKAKNFQRSLPCPVEGEAQKAAFTLIELLVVIAAIAILAVTLLPAIAGTRQNSQVVGCMDNQRQLAAAWMMFARDNNDVLVPNRGLNGATGVSYAGDPGLNPNFNPEGQMPIGVRAICSSPIRRILRPAACIRVVPGTVGGYRRDCSIRTLKTSGLTIAQPITVLFRAAPRFSPRQRCAPIR